MSLVMESSISYDLHCATNFSPKRYPQGCLVLHWLGTRMLSFVTMPEL